MPSCDPAFGDLKNMLIKDAQGLLGANTDLTSQINQGMQDIGAGYRTAGNTLQGALAARGLSNSPVAGTALSNLIASGAGEQSRLMNQQPLMEHELALANMGMAGNILGMGRGTSTTSTGTSTQTGGGGWMDALGGGLGNAAGMMGLLMGGGYLDGGKAATSAPLNALGLGGGGLPGQLNVGGYAQNGLAQLLYPSVVSRYPGVGLPPR